MWKKALVALVGGLLLYGFAATASAQPGGGGGGGRGGDPEARRQRMAEFLKERLGATDDEMKVIQPKLEKVMEARRDASGGFGFMGRGGRGGFGGGDQPQSAVARAQQELAQLLENKEARPDQIAEKLKALRDAREKARETLAAAQKDLKEVLTQRQEAVMVMMGWLD